MEIKYSKSAEKDLKDLEKGNEALVREEILNLADKQLPDLENQDVQMVNWKGDLRYRLKIVNPEKRLNHRVLFKFTVKGENIEIIGVFNRDNLTY